MTVATQSPFWSAFHAIDRLNSWVRSQNGQHAVLFGPQQRARKVIYWVKRKAIIRASKDWPCQFRRIETRVTCHSCYGSGQYDNGFWTDPCRNCNATGLAVLRFVESTIHGVRWHTPAREWASGSLDVYVGFDSYWPEGTGYIEATDWQVNAPGRAMELSEVARDFKLIDRAFSADLAFIIGFYWRELYTEYSHPISREYLQRWLNHVLHNEPITKETNAH